MRSNLTVLETFFERNARYVHVDAGPALGARLSHRLTRGDIDQFAAALAEEEGVLLLPGSFGYPGNHFGLGYGRLRHGDGRDIVRSVRPPGQE